MPVHFDPLRLVILAFLNPSDSMMFLRVAYDSDKNSYIENSYIDRTIT